MPRITVLRNLGQGLPDYREGQTVKVTNEEADLLCGAGLATLAEPSSTGRSGSGKSGGKQVQGVPKSSAVGSKSDQDKSILT